MTFCKQVAGIDFMFTPNYKTKEPAAVVEMEGFAFVMMCHDKRWRILGDVPAWIQNLEPDFGEVISNQIQLAFIGFPKAEEYQTF